MAIKLFCGKCHNFMAEVTPEEASRIQGDEICKKCHEHVDDGLVVFNREAKKRMDKIGGLINKSVLELEELRRKYLKDAL